MRAKLAVVVTVLAAAYIVAAAQQNPFVGRWNLTGTGSDDHLIYFLEVKQVGDHLEGMFLDRVAHAQPIPMIKVENGELTWQYGLAMRCRSRPAAPCIARRSRTAN